MDGMEEKKYEILKIRVPTHGVVNVYRKPGRPAGTGALKKVHRWNARGVERFSLHRIPC